MHLLSRRDKNSHHQEQNKSSERFFQASTKNFKTVWSKINEILNKKRKLEDIYLYEYEIIVTDPKLVVNQL